MDILKILEVRLLRKSKTPRLRLEQDSRIVVVGGGPAGSFFSINVLRKAKQSGKRIEVIIIEKKKELVFNEPLYSAAPGVFAHREGCNYCAGGISPRMNDILEEIGLNLPDEIIQNRVKSITVQGYWKNISIKIPPGRTTFSVFRGSRPKARPYRYMNFDSFLLEKALEEGTKVVTGEVSEIMRSDSGKPLITYNTNINGKIRQTSVEADFMVFAGGVKHTPRVNFLQNVIPGFVPSYLRKALIFELDAGEEIVRTMESEIYFILYGPKEFNLEMISIVPKGRFLTVVLIGSEIDNSGPENIVQIIHKFLELPHIRRILPRNTRLSTVCLCNPSMVIGGAKHYFDDRIAAIGDAVTSRLYKDGIYSAYLTSSALAHTLVETGIDRDSLKNNYGNYISWLNIDNMFGKCIFMVNKFIFSHSMSSRMIYQALLTERKTMMESERRLENVLWKIVSGDDSYINIFRSMFHPAAIWRVFTGGVLITFRNYLTESLFGLKWAGFGRYPTGVYKEERLAKRQEIIINPSISFNETVEFERMYTIRIHSDILNIQEELGKFGDKDKTYFNPRMINVHRISGDANQVGSIIQYDVFPSFLSFSLVLENIIQDRYIVYRIRNGFARGGILVFDIFKYSEKQEYKLSIYVAFNFAKGKTLLTKPLWYMFRLFFPGFVHDVLWNHSLCKLKDILETDQDS